MESSNNKQNDVLCAAIHEFARRGLAGTTMEAIAKKATVSKRTLYKHYANKQALFDEVVSLLLARIAQLQSYQYLKDIPIYDQLKDLAKLCLSLGNDEDYLTLSRIVIIESMRDKEQAARLEVKFLDCEKGLLTWFEQAQSAGVLNDVPADIAAAFFYGGLKKMAYWEQVIKWKPALDEARLEQLVDLTSRFFISGIKLEK
ncbi:transcriptional regulator [Pseudoalteromonas porphyrae]|uniref:Transcriptional regulator n=2 Tax=Pseudoalteromonas TaxID=53246 RepID=A0A0N1MU73_9GAMM|nr:MULTISPECIES: TetR/AcrR family transcriptional regulator [Pseudoalteromonas]KPH64216.1 transcriptional regulator [Pseudoalteromonas porphyrae]KPH96049.1 transcriptional regulator [Pseudoalteromonas porphyrae]NMR23976.1 TetR/AcrR family transcriptional regulator [Pseudoalteromonas sp. NEC-BIFX-2020_015]NNG44420.1 TetR/AcrR family transcriptional regulator [Pseudoalteromonas sp. NEC-BIFX-2020_002]